MLFFKKKFFTQLVCIILFLFAAKSMAVEQQAIKSNTVIEPIVVTEKPLYSLVAHLTAGIQTPLLLIKHSHSSHHYQLRPSERRLLASAKLIVWFGPEMETYIAKIIQQEKNKNNANVQIITAMQSKGLKLLSKRSNQHPNKTIQSEQYGRATKPQNIDPHIWLSTYNAEKISQHIAQSLISLNPQNTSLYENNLRQLLAKIKHTEQLIKVTLNENRHQNKNNNQQAFISYHDAYQYFDKENRLNYIDSISYDEESGPSLKHIREIKTLINEKNIHCLVYQLPKPGIIDSLTTQTHIHSTALDPIGKNTSNDKDAWFELMLQLAEGFKTCLNPGTPIH